MKHQGTFCPTITRGYCGKRRYYEDECHIKSSASEKNKKAEDEPGKNTAKGGEPERGGPNPWDFKGKGNSVGGRRFSAPPTGGRRAL